MIEKLLEYQEVDKQRLEIELRLHGSKVKRELDSASTILNESRANLLELESDAKDLLAAYKSVQKDISDILARVEKANASAGADTITGTLERAAALESKLDGIAKNIAQKTRLFDTTKAAVIKAQSTIKALTPKYDELAAQVSPQIKALESKLEVLAKNVDRILLEKYRARRRQRDNKPAGGSALDIVVKMAPGNRCGACYVEMPLLMISKISTDGYVACENCGKIIYK